MLSGTPTTAGSYGFTVTATDTIGANDSKSYTVTIDPGETTFKYLVTPVGSSTVQAGRGFLVTVQAADQFGNPVTSYSGPASVTASITPTSAASNSRPLCRSIATDWACSWQTCKKWAPTRSRWPMAP